MHPSSRGPGRAPSAIPAIGRWKMLDNLRRTLSAPAAVLALLAGWTLPFHAALIWTVFVVLTIALPTLIPVVAAIPPRRPGVTISSHARALGGDLRLALALSTLTIAFLADQAWLMADAIGRTLWRLGVSRRHLLEWVPAAQATIGPSSRLAGLRAPNGGRSCHWRGRCDRRFGVSPRLLAVGASLRRALVGFACRRALCKPRSCGRRPARGRCPADAQALRRTARRTWRFFETFVTPTDNMLPPDNFQEDPDAGRRASDLADQYRSLSSFRRLRSRFRLDRNRPGDRAAGGDARDDGSPADACAAISTIGTTRAIFDRSIRNTYPPSTAAIWPGISSRSPTPAANGATVPSSRRGASAASPTRSRSRGPSALACATAARPRP